MIAMHMRQELGVHLPRGSFSIGRPVPRCPVLVAERCRQSRSTILPRGLEEAVRDQHIAFDREPRHLEFLSGNWEANPVTNR
jgi:hypothetical protein